MKQIGKTIVIGSLSVACVYGIQQLNQSSVGPQKDINTLAKTEANSSINKKEKKEISLTKKQKNTIQTVAVVDDQAAFDDLEQSGEEAEFNDKGSFDVSFEKEFLTINAQNAVLSDVVMQVANKANIPVNSETIDPEKRITLSMQKVPIDTAFRELLTGYDYFLLYTAVKGKIQAAWIYPAGTGINIALNQNNSKELSEDDLFSSDPEKRDSALQHYVDSDSKVLEQHVNDAVQDEDPDVRVMAIITAQENTIELPYTVLKDLVESDPSATVRSVALNTLSMNSELSATQIEAFSESALHDEDETIREQAEAILEGLKEVAEDANGQSILAQQSEIDTDLE